MAKGAVSLSAPEGLGPEGGERVAMVPGLRGAAGPLVSLVSSRRRQCRAVQLLGYSARGWFGRPLLARALLRVSSAGVELLRCPPQQDARRGPRERARH